MWCFNLMQSSFPYPNNPQHSATLAALWRFTHTTDTKTLTLGYITPSVATALQYLPHHLTSYATSNIEDRTIALTALTPERRSQALDHILSHWRKHSSFDVLKGWRDECYPIYCPTGLLYASIERAAAPLFGVVAYCVYLIGYSVVGESKEPKLWIPRRSKTKQTYAGMLDTTVAGAMVGDESALDCVIREANEEASLSVDLVKEKAKEVGKVSHFGLSTGDPNHGDGEEGVCCPEVGTVFEMESGEGVVPQPKDGEVENFHFWSVAEVKEALERGEFKGNSGAVVVDWLTRRELLGDIDQDVRDKIAQRMRRTLDFPVM